VARTTPWSDRAHTGGGGARVPRRWVTWVAETERSLVAVLFVRGRLIYG